MCRRVSRGGLPGVLHRGPGARVTLDSDPGDEGDRRPAVLVEGVVQGLLLTAITRGESAGRVDVISRGSVPVAPITSRLGRHGREQVMGPIADGRTFGRHLSRQPCFPVPSRRVLHQPRGEPYWDATHSPADRRSKFAENPVTESVRGDSTRQHPRRLPPFFAYSKKSDPRNRPLGGRSAECPRDLTRDHTRGRQRAVRAFLDLNRPDMPVPRTLDDVETERLSLPLSARVGPAGRCCWHAE